MDSSQDNKSIDHSTNELICWSTPELKNNNIDNYSVDYINNPFDNLELRAANMDPFDLVHNQIPENSDPPCGNILSPLWKSEVGESQKNVLSTADVCITRDLELSHIEHVNNNTVECQTKDDKFSIFANQDLLSKENSDGIQINHKSQICKLILKSYHIETDIENISLCNEEEKNQIREQTRQKIDMFIEKEKEKYEKKNSGNSIFCIPQCNLESSLSITENVLNKKCIQSGSNDNLNNFNITSSNIIDINENDCNESLFLDQEIFKSSFDLNSLNPEWMEDDFSDNDGSFREVKINKSGIIIEKSDHDMNGELKFPNSTEIVKSKPNKFQTKLKPMQNKRIQYKKPLVTNMKHEMAHIPNYDYFQESSHMRLVAQSTPALNKTTALKISSSGKSSIKLKNSLLWQPVSNSIRNPITTLNATKFYKENLTNSENKIEKLPKKTNFSTNKLSGLPIPKKSTIRFEGKENMKPQ